jgi:hypothetical protein
MKIAPLFLLLLTLSLAHADDVVIEPRVSELRSVYIHSVNRYGITFAVDLYIINRSDKTVKIATANLGPTLVSQNHVLSINFGYEPMRMPNGKVVIPSESSFVIVTLHPGEAAFIASPRVLHGETNCEDVSIVYSVPEFLNQRFGLWSGTITTRGKLRLIDEAEDDKTKPKSQVEPDKP